jgi:histidine triad (HIT) family protein
MDTVFHKIIRKELPAKIEFEDDDCIVIHTIDPKAPVHLLIIPKKDMINISDVTQDDQLLLGKLMIVAKQMADSFKINDGFKLSINNGAKAGQEVMQLHIHLLGGWHSKLDEKTSQEF